MGIAGHRTGGSGSAAGLAREIRRAFALLPFLPLLVRQAERAEKAILVSLFVVFVLPTGLFLALFIPFGQVPDEPAHVARIDSLLHGEISGHRVAATDAKGRPLTLSGVVINAAPLKVTQLFESSAVNLKMTPAIVKGLDDIPWDPRPGFVYAPNTAVYFPVFYVPAALGLGVARLERHTPVDAVLAARITNLCVYVIISAFALALARRGWRVMFAALTLPMTLWLASSCNEDGLLIACSCLAAALLTRARGPRGVSYWGAAALLACVIAVKPAYLPLALFMVLPCTRMDRRDMLRAAAGMATASLPGIVWAVVMLRYVSGPSIWGPPYHPGALWPGDPARLFMGSDPAAQTLVLLHDPWLILKLPLQTIENRGLLNLQEAVGGLGNLDVLMADNMYSFWFAAIVLAALGDVLASRDTRGPRAALALVALLAVVATVIAIFDLEYLTWTEVGDGPLIRGVQGRYAIPLLPMISVALPLLRLPATRWLRGALAAPAIAMAAVGMVYLPALVLETYYLS
jgi:hypothetical protein